MTFRLVEPHPIRRHPRPTPTRDRLNKVITPPEHLPHVVNRNPNGHRHPIGSQIKRPNPPEQLDNFRRRHPGTRPASKLTTVAG